MKPSIQTLGRIPYSPISVALTLGFLALAPAYARETKTVILLEAMGASPIQCDGDPTGAQRCLEISKAESEELRSNVLVEMRLDPDCAGMAFANGVTNLADFGTAFNQIDYINAAVTYLPTTNERVWWLNIVRINNKEGPPDMGGVAFGAKEIAHKLCYVIHQEKITRQ